MQHFCRKSLENDGNNYSKKCLCSTKTYISRLSLAITYMKKLEEIPETYDALFSSLTKTVSDDVKRWIQNNVKPMSTILEVGCGPGKLAFHLAKSGHSVLAIDQNPGMIRYAREKYGMHTNLNLVYHISSAVGFLEDPFVNQAQFDYVISTFMLSELRPLEQQIFLRNAWQMLKPGGKLFLAAEFVPKGLARIPFQLKRSYYKKKMKGKFTTAPLKNFYEYLEPIGFKLINTQSWDHESIRLLHLQKNDPTSEYRTQDGPGFYLPRERKFTGFAALLIKIRSLLTGQVDHVPITPGLYQIGEPSETSPILVSSNYALTYQLVRKKLVGLNLWLLCVDSRGINVWCAARGNNFGNKQVLEAIQASPINVISSSNVFILPQLAAGGIERPKLIQEKQLSGCKVEYGPVWIKDVPEYLSKRPLKSKPAKMRVAKFTLTHRVRAGITHFTFLLSKIFMIPFLSTAILLLFVGNAFLWRLYLEVGISFLLANIVLPIMYPMSSFTRQFIFKGIFFGIINTLFSGLIGYFLFQEGTLIWFQLGVYFWISFFITMSFSGYTFSTGPREIAEEYSHFRWINLILFVIAWSLIGSSIILYFLNN